MRCFENMDLQAELGSIWHGGTLSRAVCVRRLSSRLRFGAGRLSSSGGLDAAHVSRLLRDFYSFTTCLMIDDRALLHFQTDVHTQLFSYVI
jgi:hypothetical protein